jgi:UPF0042 nucleotide-binding protein
MNTGPNGSKSSETSSESGTSDTKMEIKIISFGYKNGAPPSANLVLDVRFLKNPYWVEQLRPLTGKDEPVKRYVLDQQLAKDLLDSLTTMLSHVIPVMLETKTKTFKIALGCTGGQHRSTAVAEALAERLKKRFPKFKVGKHHRELEPEFNASSC